MAEFEKQVDKAAADSKAAKDQKAKETKEEIGRASCRERV